MKKILSTVFILLSLFAVTHSVYALTANAQDPKSPEFQIVPCDGTKFEGTECNYQSAINGFNNILKFLIWMSVPFATVMFGYAGFLYMRSGDNPSNREKAKKIFMNIAIGIFFILAAWLIVYTLISKLTTIDGSNLVGNTGKTVDEVTQLKDAPNPNK